MQVEEQMQLLLNVMQTAAKLGTDVLTLRDWVDWGCIPPPIFVGGFVRWRASDLEAWLASGCPQTAATSEEFWDKYATAILDEYKPR